MRGGLFMIDRGILDHPIVGIHNPVWFAAWLWMLGEASYQMDKKHFNKATFMVERGQFLAPLSVASKATNMSIKRFRTFLAVLEADGMVIKTDRPKGTPKGSGGTVITICNYDEYQDFEKYNAARRADQRASKGQARGRQGADDLTPITPITPKTPSVSPHSVPPRDLLGDEIPNAKSKKPAPEQFQEFWDQYPHRGGAKKGRADAEKKYGTAVASGASELTIIAAAIRYAGDRQALDGYARDPATWLNQKGWEDDIEQPTSSNSSGSHGRGSSPHRNLVAAFAAAANYEPGGEG